MTASNPTARPPTTSPQPHTDFIEVRVHTAKCDTCDKHNKLTLYRCMDCGQHVCSLCWDKSGDGSHVFGGGSRNVPESQSHNVIESDKHGGGDKGHKNARRTRASRRVHVISDDEDDLPVLKPASTTEKAGSTDASKQLSKSTNIIMDGDRHHDDKDDLPGLWPMVPARGTPVLGPGVPTADTSATESANPVMQGNPHIHEVENDPESQRTVQVYDELGRQTVSARTLSSATKGQNYKAVALCSHPPQTSRQLVLLRFKTGQPSTTHDLGQMWICRRLVINSLSPTLNRWTVRLLVFRSHPPQISRQLVTLNFRTGQPFTAHGLGQMWICRRLGTALLFLHTRIVTTVKLPSQAQFPFHISRRLISLRVRLHSPSPSLSTMFRLQQMWTGQRFVSGRPCMWNNKRRCRRLRRRSRWRSATDRR